MDAATLERIVELANKAHGPKVLKASQEPDHIYNIVDEDGKVERCEAEPEPRCHTALDLETVAKFASGFAAAGKHVEVWYHRNAVCAVLDAGTRRDVVNMPLPYSPQHVTLSHLEKTRPQLSQKDFVRLLRVDLAGCLPRGVIDSVRNLKFRQLSTGESQIGHGKASVGRQIEAELTGSCNIPEDVDLLLPVWASLFSARLFRVPCVLEIDPGAEKFCLLPLPGAIENVIREAEGLLFNALSHAIAEALPGDMPSADNVTVLYGTP